MTWLVVKFKKALESLTSSIGMSSRETPKMEEQSSGKSIAGWGEKQIDSRQVSEQSQDSELVAKAKEALISSEKGRRAKAKGRMAAIFSGELKKQEPTQEKLSIKGKNVEQFVKNRIRDAKAVPDEMLKNLNACHDKVLDRLASEPLRDTYLASPEYASLLGRKELSEEKIIEKFGEYKTLRGKADSMVEKIFNGCSEDVKNIFKSSKEYQSYLANLDYSAGAVPSATTRDFIFKFSDEHGFDDTTRLTLRFNGNPEIRSNPRNRELFLKDKGPNIISEGDMSSDRIKNEFNSWVSSPDQSRRIRSENNDIIDAFYKKHDVPMEFRYEYSNKLDVNDPSFSVKNLNLRFNLYSIAKTDFLKHIKAKGDNDLSAKMDECNRALQLFGLYDVKLYSQESMDISQGERIVTTADLEMFNSPELAQAILDAMNAEKKKM